MAETLVRTQFVGYIKPSHRIPAATLFLLGQLEVSIMRCLAVVLILLAGLHNVGQAATPDQIAVLIHQLGHSDYRERQAAFRELDSIGESALAQLRSKSLSADTELRSRANELIRRIEQRQISARILAPTMVEIDVDNMQVRDAVPHVAKLTRLPLVLAGNQTKWDRRMTYHSGKVPIWEATRGFLQAAQLTEWDGVSTVAGLPSTATPEIQHQVNFNGPNRMIIRGSRGKQPAINQILVYDGESPTLPASESSAVRLRVLPTGTPIPTISSYSDDLIIPIQVSVEPKMDWMTSAPTIKMAVGRDDQGQTLTASVVSAVSTSADDLDVIMLNAMFANQMMASGYGVLRSQFVPLRLRRGSAPTKTLNELAGVISLPIRLSEQLASIDSPFNAACSSVHNEFAELKIQSAQRLDSGQQRMEIALNLSPDAQVSFNQAGVAANVRFNGVFMPQIAPPRIVPNQEIDEYFGVSLVDSHGKRWNISETGNPNFSYNADGIRMRMTLTFTAKNGAGEPAKLVVNGSRPACAELTFNLKNVPVQ